MHVSSRGLFRCAQGRGWPGICVKQGRASAPFKAPVVRGQRQLPNNRASGYSSQQMLGARSCSRWERSGALRSVPSTRRVCVQPRETSALPHRELAQEPDHANQCGDTGDGCDPCRVPTRSPGHVILGRSMAPVTPRPIIASQGPGCALPRPPPRERWATQPQVPAATHAHIEAVPHLLVPHTRAADHTARS